MGKWETGDPTEKDVGRPLQVPLTPASPPITRRPGMLFSDWPAQSPGLNPIGNLWRIIKYNIAKRPVARTVVELEERLQME